MIWPPVIGTQCACPSQTAVLSKMQGTFGIILASPESLRLACIYLLVHNHRHQLHDLISLVGNPVACARRTDSDIARCNVADLSGIVVLCCAL